jgi:serine/threonine-protein kinase
MSGVLGPALEGATLLGRYLITDRIAQGGMAVIYRGEDQRLHRPVCVKVFAGIDRQVPVYRTIYEHFVQEAFALSRLTHPNILRIYDFGYLETDSAAPFHVSELMTGGTLNTRVHKRGRLSVEDMLAILEPITGALGEAHGLSIIHRDIKPSNILFGQAGPRDIVKLADFGIAKVSMEAVRNRANDTQQVSGSRVSLFSPGWAAPEQLRGEAVGPTADVFALGLLSTFMLTGGKRIFPDETMLATMVSRENLDAYIESTLHGFNLPPSTVEVILRACRMNPEERHQSTDELFDAFAAEVPTRSRANAARHGSRPLKPRPQVVLENLTDGETRVAAGRRLRILAAREQLDLEVKPLRLRLSSFVGANGQLRLHVKGLNCFVARQGSRPSGAVDVERDMTIEVLSNDRKRAGSVRCEFGADNGNGHLLLTAAETHLAVPSSLAQAIILLDFGAGRDLVLLYRLKKV